MNERVKRLEIIFEKVMVCNMNKTMIRKAIRQTELLHFVFIRHRLLGQFQYQYTLLAVFMAAEINGGGKYGGISIDFQKVA